jgi:DNA polymerase-3 subunit epsilon
VRLWAVQPRPGGDSNVIAMKRVSGTIAEALPEERTWPGPPTEGDLAALPGCPAVYLLLASAQVPVQLATTQHLRRLAIARLGNGQRSRPGKANLAEIVRGLRWIRVDSAFEARWRYYRLARQMYPDRYRRLISFGPAWFLHIDLQQRIPELRITKRIWQHAGDYVGPWLTQGAARKALDALLDVFELCRYPEQVRRAPEGRRCAYADMGRCDAPCDGSVPLARYVARCREAWSFVRGNTAAWLDEIRERMRQAARERRYEDASTCKRRMAWAWKWIEGTQPLVRPAEELTDLLAVPAVRRRAWRLFLLWRGDIFAGPRLTDRKLPAGATAWLREQLADLPEPAETAIRMEQTWLVAHFLASRGGSVSLVERLCGREVPADLEARLAERVAERQNERTQDAAGPDGGPDADNEPQTGDNPRSTGKSV